LYTLLSALEDGRLTVSVRLLADPADRRYLTGLLHRALLAFLAAAAGIMAVLMIGLHGGPALSKPSGCTPSSATAC
jgi:ubiquinone biosynthesis protein